MTHRVTGRRILFSLMVAAVSTANIAGLAQGQMATRVPSEALPGEPSPSPLPTTTPSPSPGLVTRPSPADAPYDVEKIFHNGCLGYESATVPPNCTYGDRSGRFTMALVGDSHASMLFPAFQKVARSHHWRLLPLVKINCPFMDLTVHIPRLPDPYVACDAWNANVVKLLNDVRPDLVVAVTFKFLRTMDPSKNTPKETGAAVGRMLAKVPGRKVVMVDPPSAWTDVPACVLAKPVADCGIPRQQVMSDGVKVREEAAAMVANGLVLNLTRKICREFPCSVITDGMLMFRDSHHLTATYARAIAPLLAAKLRPVLEATEVPPPAPSPSLTPTQSPSPLPTLPPTPLATSTPADPPLVAIPLAVPPEPYSSASVASRIALTNARKASIGSAAA
jgi:hypothetical protein